MLILTLLSKQMNCCIKWDISDHPPYSPDLALTLKCDFHLMMDKKKLLWSQRFDSDEELQDAVTGWLQSQAEREFTS